MSNTRITTGQLGKFLELLDQKQMTPERFQGLWSKLAHVFSPCVITGRFEFMVDVPRSFDDMVAYGNYEIETPRIMNPTNFPVAFSDTVEFYEAITLNFPHGIGYPQVFTSIFEQDIRNPWVPATLEQVCYFIASRPTWLPEGHALHAMRTVAGIRYSKDMSKPESPYVFCKSDTKFLICSTALKESGDYNKKHHFLAVRPRKFQLDVHVR